jgi:stage II sporulation protein D
VLSKELIKGWPRQSYEAQAIAARSYALHERRRARSLGKAWDLENDTSDQVFGGITSDRTSMEASRATRGRVLVDSAGELVRAYFSSTCGGRPVSASDAFGTPRGQEFNRAAPLQARARPHACQTASLYRWTIDRSDTDLSRRLRTWGQFNGHEVRSLSLVRSIEPARSNTAGRPIDYRVTDDRGRTFTLRGEQLRLAINQSVEGLPNVTRETRANSGDVEVSFSGGRATIRGRGFGHGVGLCQWCARGFALEGRDASQILALMYPGSKVRQTF